ncbi:Metallo-dependent phosphatase [Metschnikowia bicuspidata var. bicuspidata NRRL YB-4993]|uniref:Metallo-dependent phosphatase n=1 Tax=Metschnikowia bicuspidata var. bicuspidata NRRL YB-4993 TaxID=869754 RepID=A0A1A0H7Y4_9ASCO|nr:Metallo-dependent phosphatase [Metschnikowia bicuspidata var. bicuspidata NRRL YB-4993]OBA20008.1 Metallo-dependent phosphatase [Metschnikowia bicuspidata var. bicuspidata NRRL YB-4993]
MFPPRRLLRGLIYVSILAFFVLFALLMANRRRIIHLDEFLPSKIMPLYFQPGSDSYVVDIAVGDCNILSKNSAKCGVPRASDGLYGDVGTNGGWVRVEKDLLLGKHWTSKRYLSVKRISSEYYERNRGDVILDIAVGDPEEDCAIRGNKKCIPKSIMTEINMKHIFNEEDLANLRDLNKDEKPNLQTDKSKSALEYNKDYEQRKNEKYKALADVQSTDSEKSEVSDDKKTSAASTNDKDASDQSKEDSSDLSSEEKETIEDTDSIDGLDKRYVEKSHHNLKNYMRIPSDQEIADSKWKKKSNNIWVKLGQATDDAVSGVDILFGEDAVDPRPNWDLARTPLKKLAYSSSLQPRLSIRKGEKVDYKSLNYLPKIQFNAEGKFKVLQVADLHFSTGVGVCRDPVPEESAKGCEADPRTISFLNRVLDIEKPDFVVLTGDQVFGDEAPDPETALLKAVNPFIKRQIPFAITLGNHDDESILSREQMMNLASSLPYLLATVGPEIVDGFGNYQVTINKNGSKKMGAVLYFLDSHSRSKQPKSNPGYDWFKESQVDWLQMQAMAKKDAVRGNSFLSMAFFHIPLPEYRNLDQPRVGQHKEGITAPKYQTKMREALGVAGVQVVSCGHDHANDFCLVDTQNQDSDAQNLMWLCYGGGAGEGGYGGYGGYIRRVRVFELNSNEKTIETWKRAENNPDEKFDQQLVVEQGSVVTSV